MKRFLRKLLIGIYVFLLCLGTPMLEIRAIESETTEFEVSLEIDNSIGDLTGLFDDIGRFSKSGIAKIVKAVSIEYQEDNQAKVYHAMAYGLINNQGEVLVEPKYDIFYDFNDKYYVFGQSINDGKFNSKVGLISKENGSIVLEPKYVWIPSLKDSKLIFLDYRVPNPEYTLGSFTEEYLWKTEIKAYRNEVFEDVVVPTGINVLEYDNYYLREVEGLHLLTASRRICSEGCVYDNVSWLVDDNGDRIVDLAFDFESGVVEIDGAHYLAYQNQIDRLNHVWEGGLVKIINNGQDYSIQVLLNPVDGYTNIWINKVEKRAYFYQNLTLDSGYSQSGYVDLVSNELVDLGFNGAQPEKMEFAGYSHLDITREYTRDPNDSTRMQSFISIKDLLGNTILETGIYNYVYLDRGDLILNKWQNNINFSNVIIEANGVSRLLFTEPKQGYLHEVADNYYQLDVSSETSWSSSLYRADSNQVVPIYENKASTWANPFSHYILIHESQKTADNQYRYYQSIIDTNTNELLIDHKENMNYWYDGTHDVISGSYFDAQASTWQKFFFKSGELVDFGFNYDAISNFDENGYITLRHKGPSYTCVSGVGVCQDTYQTLINGNGDILVSDAIELNFYDNERVVVSLHATYDGNTRLEETRYTFLDNSENGVQIPLRFSMNDKVTFFESEKVALLENKMNEIVTHTYVRDGVLLDKLNALLLNANKKSVLANGLVLYKIEDSSSDLQQIYVSDLEGNFSLIEGATDFIGQIIKYSDGRFEMVILKQIDQNESFELVEIPNTISDAFTQISHLMGNIYQNYSLERYTLISLEPQNINGIFEITSTAITNEKGGSEFCKFEAFEQHSNLRLFTLPIDGICSQNKFGLLDQQGKTVVTSGFDSIYLSNGLFVASKDQNSVTYTSIYDKAGTDLFASLNPTNASFSNVNLESFPYIQVDENSVRKLYYYNGLNLVEIGNFYVQKVNGSNHFLYSDSSNFGNRNGVLDENGNVLIDIGLGYSSFSFDIANKLIYPMISVNGSNYQAGLYDFSGTKLLDNRYSVRLQQGGYGNIVSGLKSAQGHLVIEQNSKYLHPFYDASTGEIKEFTQRMKNYYDLQNKRLLFGDTVVSETATIDGYYLTRVIVDTDILVENRDMSLYREEYDYYFDESGIKRLAIQVSVIYDANGNKIFTAGENENFVWNAAEDLVQTTKMECFIDESGEKYCSGKNGLIDKLGNVILEPIYSQVKFNEKYRLYEYSTNDNKMQSGFSGILDEYGNKIIEGEYRGGVSIREDYGWVVLTERMKLVTDRNDSSKTGYVPVSDVVDIATGKVLFKDLRYFYPEQLDRLNENNHLVLRIVQDVGNLKYQEEFNSDTQNVEMMWVMNPDIKYGIIDKKGDFLLAPDYEILNDLFYEKNGRSSNPIPGYYIFGNKIQTQNCAVSYENETLEIVTSEYSCDEVRNGIYAFGKGVVVDQQFSYISGVNAEGYVTVNKNYGFEEVTKQIYSNKTQTLVERTDRFFNLKQGLLRLDDGELIIPAIYDQISEITPDGMGTIYSNIPTFNELGLVKLINRIEMSDERGQYTKESVGLANKNGVLFEADNQKAYLRNGYYYLKKWNGTWEIINSTNLEDRISFDLDTGDRSVDSIELIGDKIIIGTLVIDGLEEYSVYGVLNRDLTVFLESEFNSISTDGTLWYLEKYDPLFGSYPRAVMDSEKVYIIPFTDRYDSLSEFVGGYAIGQSGSKEVTDQTSALEMPSLISAFFLDVHAAEDDFVLEVIDEQGRVVGDLSDEYESATLLGEVNGVIKALVQKDGKYFIANMVKTPIQVVKITGIELSNSSISLKVDEQFQLVGRILPETYTERKTVSWTTENSSVAVVDQNGVVKAVGPGTTIVKYKVNDFEVFATVNVQKPVIVTPPNQEVKDAVDTFVETIKAIIKPNVDDVLSAKDEFIQQLKVLRQKDANYLQYLTEEERFEYEDKLGLFFGDQINIEVEDGSLPINVKGLLLNIDIVKLLKGETIGFKIRVDKKDSVDGFRSFIDNQRYDDSIYHSFDLSIVDEKGNELKEFVYPIEFTLPLPEELRGKGELVLLHNHNDEISTLPVTLNIDFTFSFKTNKLSEFALIQDMKRIVEGPGNQSGSGISFTPFIFGGLGLILIAVSIWFIRRKRISSI